MYVPSFGSMTDVVVVSVGVGCMYVWAVTGRGGGGGGRCSLDRPGAASGLCRYRPRHARLGLSLARKWPPAGGPGNVSGRAQVGSSHHNSGVGKGEQKSGTARGAHSQQSGRAKAAVVICGWGRGKEGAADQHGDS